MFWRIESATAIMLGNDGKYHPELDDVVVDEVELADDLNAAISWAKTNRPQAINHTIYRNVRTPDPLERFAVQYPPCSAHS